MLQRSPSFCKLLVAFLSTTSMKLRFSEDDVAWCLSETLDDDSLETFMILGPGTRFTREYDAWKRKRREIAQRFKSILSQRQTDLHVILERDSEDTKAKIRAAVVGEVLKAFP
jgi:hypothetical protein